FQEGHPHLAAIQETHLHLIAVRLISWLRLTDDQSGRQRRCEQQREAKNSRHVRLQGRSDRPTASLSRASPAATSHFLVLVVLVPTQSVGTSDNVVASLAARSL